MTKVRTASRSTGGVAMMLISRTPGERQLQRARDRRRGQRQHMHIGLELLQPLLLRDAEMLLLVDDQQAEMLEARSTLASSACVPIDDVDAALGELLLDLASRLRAATSRDSCAMRTGNPAKRSVKVRKCWRASSVVGTTTATCVPGHRRDEGGAQRHLGLAEADIAADQPVHRLARRQVVERVGDRAQLVLGLGIGEARGEFLVEALGRRHRLALAELALGGDRDQLAGDLAMRFLTRALRDCQATPPSGRAATSASSEP